MMQVATITSKRQLTIPVNMFKAVGFEVGQKVIVTKLDDALKIERPLNLLSKLAGSVTLPKHLKGVNLEKVIKKAKRERFLDK